MRTHTLVKSLVVKWFAARLVPFSALILFQRMPLFLDFILERLAEPWLALDLTLAWTCVIKRLGLMLLLEKFGLPQLQEISVRFHPCWIAVFVHFHLLVESKKTGSTTLSVTSFRHDSQQSEGVALSGGEPAAFLAFHRRVHLLAGNIL